MDTLLSSSMDPHDEAGVASQAQTIRADFGLPRNPTGL